MICALILSASLGAVPAQSAEINQRVEALYAEGVALYKAGKYRLSISKFEAAFALFEEPNLLYNQARAYEALGELEVAADKYRAAASHRSATPDLVAKSNDKVSFIEGVMRATKSAREPKGDLSGSKPTPTPTPVGAGLDPKPKDDPVPEEEGSALPLIIGGVVAVVVVAAGAGAAVAFLTPGPAFESTLDPIAISGQ